MNDHFLEHRCGHEGGSHRALVPPHEPISCGLEEGLSKTNLVVVEADGHVLLETRIDHFGRDQDQQPS